MGVGRLGTRRDPGAGFIGTSLLTGFEWFLVGIASYSIGLAKAGLGGFAMVAVVLMAMVMPARDSTGAILTLLITADLFAIIAYRRHAVWSTVFRLLPASILGIVVGWLIMPGIPAATYGKVIGWMTLALIAMLVILKRMPDLVEGVARRNWAAWTAGMLGGITTMLANAAGPVMTVYLLANRLTKMAFVGTAAWFFFIVNVAKLPFSASLGLIDGKSLMMTLIMVPVVIAGGFSGRWVLGKLNQQVFEILLIAFAIVGAARLILVE